MAEALRGCDVTEAMDIRLLGEARAQSARERLRDRLSERDRDSAFAELKKYTLGYHNPPLTDEELQDLLAEVRGPTLPAAVCAATRPQTVPPQRLGGAFGLAGEIWLIAADGGVGKTTMMLAASAAIAGGVPLFDNPAFAGPAGPVLYVSEEDDGGVLQNRLEALCHGHCWDEDLILSQFFFLARVGTSLDDPRWQSHILAETTRLGAVLVVLDPLFELTNAGESNEDVKPVLKFARRLSNETSAAVCIVHHAGKAVEGKRKLDRIRGASALNAAARVIYFLDDVKDGITVECIKFSRGVPPAPFVLRRTVNVDPANPLIWLSAKLSFMDRSEAERENGERFVLEKLQGGPPLTTTELKSACKGMGVGAVEVSGAIKQLAEKGEICYDPGPHNSKLWRVSWPEDTGNHRLPGCLPIAGQPECAPQAVAPTYRGNLGQADRRGGNGAVRESANVYSPPPPSAACRDVSCAQAIAPAQEGSSVDSSGAVSWSIIRDWGSARRPTEAPRVPSNRLLPPALASPVGSPAKGGSDCATS